MQQFSSILKGLANSLSIRRERRRRRRRGDDGGREAAEALAREAKKKDMILRSCGSFHAESSNSFVCVHTQRGEKGVNQDCCVVWEVIFNSRFSPVRAFGLYVEFLLTHQKKKKNSPCCSPLYMIYQFWICT